MFIDWPIQSLDLGHHDRNILEQHARRTRAYGHCFVHTTGRPKANQSTTTPKQDHERTYLTVGGRRAPCHDLDLLVCLSRARLTHFYWRATSFWGGFIMETVKPHLKSIYPWSCTPLTQASTTMRKRKTHVTVPGYVHLKLPGNELPPRATTPKLR